MIFGFAIAFASQTNVHTAFAKIVVQECGCGNKKCSGCLLGKLRPAKRTQRVEAEAAVCDCAACRGKAVGAEQVVSDVLISQEFLPEVTAAPSCGGCAKPGCTTCRPRRARPVRFAKMAPQADCDFCELKVEATKEKRKCQKVEQKEVCVPPVRLPWQKCCPPTRAKVRVVNVLKSDSYECPTNKYSWNVYEPEVPKTEKDAAVRSLSDSLSDPSSTEKAQEAPPAPVMNRVKLQDAEAIDLNSVPRPPLEKN